MSSATSNILNADSLIQFSPIGLIRSGYYHYSSGDINVRNSEGLYWEAVATPTAARYLTFRTAVLRPLDNNRGYGMALRCLVR